MSFMKEILEQNIPIWDKCAELPFLTELQSGALPTEKFKHYMIQDSIYLKHYARILGKAIYHSETLKEIKIYYSILNFLSDKESAVRLKYLEIFGIADDDTELITPCRENKNYIDFLIAAAEQGDNPKILMAVLPCLMSYSYIFGKMNSLPNMAETKYYDFIADYADEKYYEDCWKWADFAEEKCAILPEAEKRELKAVFKKASMLELDFWKMAYKTKE